MHDLATSLSYIAKLSPPVRSLSSVGTCNKSQQRLSFLLHAASASTQFREKKGRGRLQDGQLGAHRGRVQTQQSTAFAILDLLEHLERRHTGKATQ